MNSTRSRNCRSPSSIIGFVSKCGVPVNFASAIHTTGDGTVRAPTRIVTSGSQGGAVAEDFVRS